MLTAAEKLKQKRKAIAKATKIREERRMLKEEIREGMTFTWALGERCVQTMEIRKLLRCFPTFGEAKTLKTLRALGISPSTQVQNLSDSRRRQLEELVG